jgi:hypothetical protein
MVSTCLVYIFSKWERNETGKESVFNCVGYCDLNLIHVRHDGIVEIEMSG